MKKLIILFLMPFCAVSQSNWEKTDASAFMDVMLAYEQSIAADESYSFETGYKIYRDHADQQHIQSFDGKLICRTGRELNVNQMGQLMVQDGQANVTIDTLGKQIIVQKPDLSFFHRKTVQDYAAFSEMAETAYRKISDGKTMYMLELKKGYPYQAMEFVFTEKDVISRIVIYSSQPYYTEGGAYSADKAKIVLDFKNFRKGKAVEFSGFNTVKDCIIMKDNEIIPVGKYKGFEIIDLRN